MKHLAYLTALCAVALSGCSGGKVKDTLGLSRSAPDEFRVVSRPPLSVPPQFNLRPPSATAEAPGALPASKQAESLVLGTNQDNDRYTIGGEVVLSGADTAVIPVTAGQPGSEAESQLLRNAGASQADPSIRDRLVEERAAVQEAQSDSWWNAFSSPPESKDPVVSAKAESERIKKNEEEGKPVNEGETPTVKSKDTGVLGKIFGY